MYSFRYKIMIVTVVAIIIIIIIGLTSGGRQEVTFIEKAVGGVISPVQRFISLGSRYFSDITSPITNLWKLDEENRSLKEENERLQREIIELTLTRQELEDLKELKRGLRYIEENGIEDYISCNVIGKDPGNLFSIFTIDAGSKHGVTKDSAVINGDGLVGIVYEVGTTWSKVVTLVDSNSRVSFEVLSVKDNDIGIITGTDSETLEGYLINPKSNAKKYDRIITSGLGLYPKGILIGYITDVIVDKEELLPQVIVKPSVDFKKIDRVIVIPNK